MLLKVHTALAVFCLALGQGCATGAGDRAPGAAAGQTAPTPQTVAASVTPETPRPGTTGGTAPAGNKSGACRLLTSEDIEAVQGEGVKEMRDSQQADGGLLVGQCFYATATFNRSVSLTLTQKDAASPEALSPRKFWKKQFGGEKERGGRREETERDSRPGERREREEEEGERPAQPVRGVGDEAYWAGNQKVGVLYVLKGNQFLRISIGGPEDQAAKIAKMKELAKRALKRL